MSRREISQDVDGESGQRWYILGRQVGKQDLPKYLELFRDYFGEPIKPFSKKVVECKTPLRDYISSLNRMNAFLVLGIAVTKGYITIDGVVRCGVELLGGCRRPPINLFDAQEMYGRRDSGITEIVRICPHVSQSARRRPSTIEYMVHLELQ